MRSFAVRSLEAELMDDPAVDEATLRACLVDLATVNSWTLARRPTLRWLAKVTRGLPRGASFSLLDVGYGEGDMLRAVHRWATKRGLRPVLAGVDLSPWSETAARAETPAGMAIDYRTGDVFDVEPGGFDVIVSSIVTHHMSDDLVVRFLRLMESSAARGWFVNDLHRHWLAYHGFKAFSAMMRWHAFVRHDGPLSVARAFTRADWERLIGQAGLDRRTIEVGRVFPFRICVGRIK